MKTKPIHSIFLMCLTILATACQIQEIQKPEESIGEDIQVKYLKSITRPKQANSDLNAYQDFYKYDEQGRTISIESFTGTGELRSKFIYEYTGDTTKFFEYFRDILERYTVSFPERGMTRQEIYGKTRLKPGVHYDSITYLGHTLTTLNTCGRTERVAQYNWLGNLYGYDTFHYTDENGSSQVLEFSADESLIFKQIITKNDRPSPFNKTADFDCFSRSAVNGQIWDYRSGADQYLREYNWEYEYEEGSLYPVSSRSKSDYDTLGSLRLYEYYEF